MSNTRVASTSITSTVERSVPGLARAPTVLQNRAFDQTEPRTKAPRQQAPARQTGPTNTCPATGGRRSQGDRQDIPDRGALAVGHCLVLFGFASARSLA